MPTPAECRWEPIVRRARQSGMSIRAYAREHGINENTLAWWNWKVGDSLEEGFVEAAVVPVVARTLRLYVGGAHIEVDELTDLGLLRRLVEALS